MLYGKLCLLQGSNTKISYKRFYVKYRPSIYDLRYKYMLIKHNNDFFIQWDTTYYLENNLELGVFNFWIDDHAYPGKWTNITLIPLFNDLISNLEEIHNIKQDLGAIPLSHIDFSLSNIN